MVYGLTSSFLTIWDSRLNSICLITLYDNTTARFRIREACDALASSSLVVQHQVCPSVSTKLKSRSLSLVWMSGFGQRTAVQKIISEAKRLYNSTTKEVSMPLQAAQDLRIILSGIQENISCSY